MGSGPMLYIYPGNGGLTHLCVCVCVGAFFRGKGGIGTREILIKVLP